MINNTSQLKDAGNLRPVLLSFLQDFRPQKCSTIVLELRAFDDVLLFNTIISLI